MEKSRLTLRTNMNDSGNLRFFTNRYFCEKKVSFTIPQYDIAQNIDKNSKTEFTIYSKL